MVGPVLSSALAARWIADIQRTATKMALSPSIAKLAGPQGRFASGTTATYSHSPSGTVRTERGRGTGMCLRLCGESGMMFVDIIIIGMV